MVKLFPTDEVPMLCYLHPAAEPGHLAGNARVRTDRPDRRSRASESFRVRMTGGEKISLQGYLDRTSI